MNEDACVCAKCHRDYALREGCEPSKYCDACVHDVVAGLEAENARLRRELEASKAAHTSTFNKMERQRENVAGLNATVFNLQKDLAATRRAMATENAAREQETAGLRQELEDVRGLDEWLKGETSGECRDWEMMYDSLTTGEEWYCTLTSNTGVTDWEHDTKGDTPGAARRGAVEYLKSREGTK